MKQKLTMLMSLFCITIMSWAGTVNIPTAVGSYISTAEATLTNCNSESEGKNIGSTRNGSTMTVSLNNTTAGDYILQFLSGASGLSATVDVNVNGGGFDKTQSFNIVNTNDWTPSEFHAMELKNLPAGALTLKLTVTSTTGSYAGNYGSFAVYKATDYDQCPGNITLANGVYKRARFQDPNVGYVDNGATATYPFYNTTNGVATLYMGMDRYNDGTVTVTVTDVLTGVQELQTQFVTTTDLCQGIKNPSAIELGSISKGLKTIKLSFGIANGYVCNYANVSLGVQAQWQNIAQNTETDVFEIGSSAASTIYYTVNNDGTLAKQPTEDGATGALTAKWSGTSHGYLNYENKITIPAGVFKIGLGTCQYGTGTSSITDADENALTVRTADGVDVTSFNTNDGTCYHQNKTANIKYVYYQANEEQTIIIKTSNYVPYFTVESANAMPALSTKYDVTYSNSDALVAGTVPAAENVVVGSQITIPANRTLYKDGYTLTGWTDGANNYRAGDKVTVNSDITLTPIFRANAQNINTRYDDVEVKWDFQRKNGAPTLNVGGNTAGIYVAQANVNGEAIDVKMDYNTKSGKLANAAWMDWAQLNGGFEFYLPSANGASVSMETYSVSTATTIDGVALTSNTSKTPSATIASENNPVTVVYGGDASYFRWISITLPKNADDPSGTNPWDNFQDIAIDFTNGAYITSEEQTVTTIGVKKDGENVVRTTSDDADAIATVAGKFHSNEHGLQNFRMTIGVPGNVRISAGTCAWGGNLTVKKGGVTVATVNTNNGTCFHQNKTNNKVITYYEGEATTLTIEGGNYMPFISVESIDNVPSQYTLTFKNGETTVAVKQIYEGTGVGTTPTIDGLASDQYFLGWYSNASQIDTRVNAATVPAADVTYYAVVKNINTNDAGQLAPEAGDAFSFLAHLEKANKIATAETPAQIFLANGTYDLGTLINTEVSNNVHIFGESRDGVLIVNHPNEGGMSNSETLNVRGSNVYMQNFSVRCDVSYPESKVSHVGTAIRTYGDKNIFYNMDMQGNQDTFNTPMGENAVAYVKGGRIEGTVDYICGSGNILFEGVNLYMNARSNADVIAAPSTAAATQYGYVFNNCTIDGDAGQDNNYNLARPWNNNPAATWINTKCIIKPSAKGYTTMGNHAVRFHEYNTHDAEGNEITGHSITGLGYDEANSDAIYLDNVGDYTYANVLGGWDPEAIIAQYNGVTVEISDAGYATFVTPYAMDFSGTGITAYTVDADIENSVVHMTSVDQVPANKAIVVKGAEGTANIPVIASASDFDTDLTYSATATAYDAQNTYYYLGQVEGKVGFRPLAEGGSIAAGKCYISIPVAQQSKPLSISFDDTITDAGVVEATPATTVKNGKYTENGQIVIVVNGKKYNVAGMNK